MTGATIYDISDFLRKPMPAPKKYQVEWHCEASNTSYICYLMAQDQAGAIKRAKQVYGFPDCEIKAVMVWDGKE